MIQTKMKSHEIDDDSLPIDCPFCGKRFSKSNKPFILKCSHNICSACLEFNFSSLICLICKVNCSQKALTSFPQNFLLAEVVEKIGDNGKKKKNRKSSKSKDEGLESNFSGVKYYCNNCNLVILNQEYHQKNYIDHDLVEYNGYIDSKKGAVLKKEEELNKSFSETKEKYLKIHNDYFNQIVEITCTKMKDMIKSFEDNYNLLENLYFLGFINLKEKIILETFIKKYQEVIKTDFSQIKNIDDLYKVEISSTKFSTEEEKKKYFNDYLSELKSLERILGRLNNLEQRFSKIEETLETADLENFTNNFLEDIIVKTNHSLNINLEKKTYLSYSYQLTADNKIVLFNPISLDFEVYDLKKLDNYEAIILEGSSMAIDSDSNLYISGGLRSGIPTNQFVKIKLNHEKLEAVNLVSLLEPRAHHKSLIAGNRIYLYKTETDPISNTPVHFIDVFHLFLHDWSRLPLLPSQFTRIDNLVYGDGHIFVIENFKKMFYLEEDEKKKWKQIKATFADPIDINLKNYLVIPKNEYLYFLGGEDAKGVQNHLVYKFSIYSDEFKLVEKPLPKGFIFNQNTFAYFNEEYYIMDTQRNEDQMETCLEVSIYKSGDLKKSAFVFEKSFHI